MRQSTPCMDSTPISNNAPGFKYKYPQAKPTPAGIDDTAWNKIYTAADSRNYNKHNKSANESKKYRERGDTYELALKMLQEKIEKDKKGGEPALKKAKVAALKRSDSFSATVCAFQYCPVV
jgi:COMPASS component SPP1